MRIACKIITYLSPIFVSVAHAQYPEKPIRLVVGFTAGGPTDLPARYIAERLGERLGQRVVVENRAGAGGQIATQDVLARPRDGYNLLLCTHFEGINLAIYRNAAYKLADIAPITQISRYYYGVVAANEVPAADWESFIAYARENPSKLNYGMVGRGSAQEILALELAQLACGMVGRGRGQHFLALDLAKLAGIRMTGVPSKGGADALNDLSAGRVHFYASPTLAVLPQHRAGRIRLLAVTAPERLAVAP